MHTVQWTPYKRHGVSLVIIITTFVKQTTHSSQGYGLTNDAHKGIWEAIQVYHIQPLVRLHEQP